MAGKKLGDYPFPGFFKLRKGGKTEFFKCLDEKLKLDYVFMRDTSKGFEVRFRTKEDLVEAGLTC